MVATIRVSFVVIAKNCSVYVIATSKQFSSFSYHPPQVRHKSRNNLKNEKQEKFFFPPASIPERTSKGLFCVTTKYRYSVPNAIALVPSMNINTRNGSWVQAQTGASERYSVYLNPANTNVEISWMGSVAGLIHSGGNHIAKGIGTGCPALVLGAVLSVQQECLRVVTSATGHLLNSHCHISYCKIRLTHYPLHHYVPHPTLLMTDPILVLTALYNWHTNTENSNQKIKYYFFCFDEVKYSKTSMAT